MQGGEVRALMRGWQGDHNSPGAGSLYGTEALLGATKCPNIVTNAVYFLPKTNSGSNVGAPNVLFDLGAI